MKDHKFRYLNPTLGKRRTLVDGWFLFAIIELFSLSPELLPLVEELQGKTCQDSLLSGGVGQFEPRFQEEGVVLGEYFLLSTKLDTFCYLTVQTAPC